MKTFEDYLRETYPNGLAIDAGKNVGFNLTIDQLVQLFGHHNVAVYIGIDGLKDVLTDSHASVVLKDFKTEDEWIAAKRAKAELKLGALMNGDVRQSRASRMPKLSDFDAFARKWILAKAKAKMSKDDWKAKTDGDNGAAWIAALVEKNLPKFHDDITADFAEFMAAKKREAELADSMDLDI